MLPVYQDPRVVALADAPALVLPCRGAVLPGRLGCLRGGDLLLRGGPDHGGDGILAHLLDEEPQGRHGEQDQESGRPLRAASEPPRAFREAPRLAADSLPHATKLAHIT